MNIATTFGKIKIFGRFKIVSEPNSEFYKECDRYDGAVNAYKTKKEFKDNILEPVTFSKDYDVERLTT